jgi:ribosome maturation factor RimP
LRASTPFEERLLALIEPTAADLGYEIVRIRLMGNVRKTLQIMAERARDAGMDAEDCATLSRAISPVIDVEDPISGAWALEVSSPGIDRPLTRLKDFAAWEGFEARVELVRMVENRKRFKGVLAGVEDGAVLLNIDGEEGTAVIPFSMIDKAKLVMTDALLAEGAARMGVDLGDGLDGEDEEAPVEQTGDRSA